MDGESRGERATRNGHVPMLTLLRSGRRRTTTEADEGIMCGCCSDRPGGVPDNAVCSRQRPRTTTPPRQVHAATAAAAAVVPMAYVGAACHCCCCCACCCWYGVGRALLCLGEASDDVDDGDEVRLVRGVLGNGANWMPSRFCRLLCSCLCPL